jgi:predicted RNA-binding protein
MVTSPESFQATQNKNLLGFYGDSKSQILYQTAVGDIVVFYVTKEKVVRGVFEVASEPFLDLTPMYGDDRDDRWNQRIKLKPVDTDASFDMRVLKWDLDFIKDKGLSYSAYLVNTLIKLTEKDFATIIEALDLQGKIREKV